MGHEYKVYIDGVAYGMSDIESAKIEHPLFDKLSVGNTCSAELDMTFWPQFSYSDDFDIPEMAKIVPMVRDTDSSEAQEAVQLTLDIGYAGVSAGTYSVELPGIGKIAVVFTENRGTFERVTITAVTANRVTATITPYDWFNGRYDLPETLTAYAVQDDTLPDLIPYACMHETPEAGCDTGHCSENPVVLSTVEFEQWTQLGVFYIDTRRASAGDKLHIIAYDAMMRGDIVWEPDQQLKFPMPMDQAVQVICDLMEVELDSRTMLSSSYTIDYPANDWTLRDVLGFIGAAHAGNWIITAEGKLLLVPLFDSMPQSTGYLVSEDGSAITFGGVRIRI